MAYLITEITQAKRNVERANVFLNGHFWLGVNKNMLLELKLTKGRELTEIEKQKIEQRATDRNLIEKAITYATLRPRTISEVRSYLVYRKKVSDEEAETVIAQLTEQGLLSDERFVHWYLELKTTTGANGVNKIKAELLQKGVSRVLVEKELAQLAEIPEFVDDQHAKIKEFAEKAIKTIKAKDQYDLKSKLTSRLLARGFRYGEIKEIIKELVK